MSKIKTIIDTLGGWKKAWSLVKPSSSTTIMAVALAVLVALYPEHHWSTEDDNKTQSQPAVVHTDKGESGEKNTPSPLATREENTETNTEETSVQNNDTSETTNLPDSDSTSYEPIPSQQESPSYTPDNSYQEDDSTGKEYNNTIPSEDIPSTNQEPTVENGSGDTVPNYNQGRNNGEGQVENQNY